MTAKQRYNAGRFRAKRFAAAKWKSGGTNTPDFMYGTVKILAYLSGEISVQPSLRGMVKVNT